MGAVLDGELLRQLVRNHAVLITVEEGAIGGFSAQVVDFLMREDLLDQVKFRALYMPDAFVDQDKPNRQVAQAGLDGAGIAEAALAALARIDAEPAPDTSIQAKPANS